MGWKALVQFHNLHPTLPASTASQLSRGLQEVTAVAETKALRWSEEAQLRMISHSFSEGQCTPKCVKMADN